MFQIMDSDDSDFHTGERPIKDGIVIINESGNSKNEGSRLNPKFLNTGHGGRNNSVIFHTEEDGKHYQYHRNVVSKDDLQLTCMYRKNRRANCRAGMRLKPKKHDLTYKRKINGEVRYFSSQFIYHLKLSNFR